MGEEDASAGAPLAEVIETSGAAVIGITASGIVSAWNTAAEELYGYRSSEMVGRPLSRLRLNGAEREWTHAFDGALLGRRTAPMTVTRRRRDGTPVNVSVYLGPMRVIDTPTRIVSEASPEPGTPPDLSIDELPLWFESLPVTTFVIDLEGHFLSVSGPALRKVGLNSEDLVGTKVFDFLDDGARTVFDRALTGADFTVSAMVAGEIWEVTFTPLHRDGELVAVCGCVVDATGRWQNEEALALHEARFRALVQHSTDVMAVMAADTTITYVSPSITTQLGYEPEEIEGTSILDYIHPLDLPRVVGRFQRIIDRAEESLTLETRLRHKDGSWRHYELVHGALHDDPAVKGIVVNGRDVTERVEGEQRLERLAVEDPVTGLPNRALLLDRVGQHIRAETGAREPLAAIVIDLDHFHLINDSHGHAFGDDVLIEVGRRLLSRCGPRDTAARLAADTFVVVRPGVSLPDVAEAFARRLLEAVASPMQVGTTTVTVTACAGIALDTGPYHLAEDLIGDADAAKYGAKASGPNAVELYVEAHRSQARERLQTEQELRHAIGSGQLRVHYQPVISLEDGGLSGVEALVRWQHPERGLVAPVTFVPLAEETGLIVPLGEFVLRDACRQAAAWARNGIELQISVNLSPRQLYDRDFASTLSTVLEETGHPAERLTLEVTESVLVDDAVVVNRALDALTDLGVSLAIDDFGTGYSSLVSLRRLPVDTLKIDRSFVAGLGRDEEDEAIVDAVVHLGKALGLRIVAEGVETEEQRDLLRARGCDEVQGFLYQRPVPAEELGEWVRAREAL
jgi:diguanylate cyclase (GGDEF)-like protein/PAS domain S-box-containing protein